MAAYNKTLGRFELVGIAPAPRGVPQIEVTFDIDANGIVHVSAKDLGTGKEQSIQITASSGLSEDQIKSMVRDAEAHAGEDASRKRVVEARNHLDGVIYSTENALREHGAKVDAGDKASIEAVIADAKKVLEKSSDAEEMKRETEKVSQASHKLAETIYKTTTGGAAGGPEAGGFGGAAGGPGAGSAGGEQVVDADFEEVK